MKQICRLLKSVLDFKGRSFLTFVDWIHVGRHQVFLQSPNYFSFFVT